MYWLGGIFWWLCWLALAAAGFLLGILYRLAKSKEEWQEQDEALTGGPIPEEDNAGGFKKDSTGKLILSKLDEESLRKIADTTGGRYVRSLAGDLDLDILFSTSAFPRTRSTTRSKTKTN